MQYNKADRVTYCWPRLHFWKLMHAVISFKKDVKYKTNVAGLLRNFKLYTVHIPEAIYEPTQMQSSFLFLLLGLSGFKR